MKGIVVGGLTGACVCLTVLAILGAGVSFIQGAGAGYENEKPPFTLAAAALGAFSFVLAAGVPTGIVGLVVGSAVADVRRNRNREIAQGTLSRPLLPSGVIGVGMMDIILGLGPFLLSGMLLLGEEAHRLDSGWLSLSGQILWFITGLLMIIMGLRLLFDKHQALGSALGLRVSCAICLVALALWGHVYVSQSPSDPSGALKAGAYVLLVGAAVVVLGFLLCSTWYVRRISGQVAVGQGRTNG